MENYIRKWVAEYAEQQHIAHDRLICHWIMRCFYNGVPFIIMNLNKVLNTEMSDIHRYYLEMVRYHCIRHAAFLGQDILFVKRIL